MKSRTTAKTLGTTANDDRVILTVRVVTTKAEPKQGEQAVRLLFSFSRKASGARLAHTYGAGTGWSIDQIVQPADGFTLDKLARISELVRAWHRRDTVPVPVLSEIGYLIEPSMFDGVLA